MAAINHNAIGDYYKARPQLKRPKFTALGWEIPAEWKAFVESLINQNEELKRRSYHGHESKDLHSE